MTQPMETITLKVSATNPAEMYIESHGIQGECTKETVAYVLAGGGADPKVLEERPPEVHRQINDDF